MTKAQPSMRDIAAAQEAHANISLRLASRKFYGIARRLHFASGSVNLLLALGSPFVLVYRPDWGPFIGAIAGGWLFVSRQLLSPFTERFQRRGATVQELFDCSVFGLQWNDALARPIALEDIAAASRKRKKTNEVENWYPAEGDAAWPTSVLVCQRSNAVWGRRQHRLYGYLLRGTAILWGIVGIVVAITHDASTADYLVTVALPSLPALLDASELADMHMAAANSRERLEERVDSLLQGGEPESQDLRDIQDQLFNMREIPSIVPKWFYRLVRRRYETDMRDAAKQLQNKGGQSSNGA